MLIGRFSTEADEADGASSARPAGYISSLAFAPDGKTVASTNTNGMLKALGPEGGPGAGQRTTAT